MKSLTPSQYQKLFEPALLEEFPEIEDVFVTKNWALKYLVLNINLKPAEQQKSMISAKHLLGRIESRLKELGQYYSASGMCVLNIYFEGELLAHDAFLL